MKPSKSIPLAVTVVIIAVASIIAPIAITESWFSDEDSADITITLAVLKIEKIGNGNTIESTEYWDGNSVKTLDSGKYKLSPAVQGSSINVYYKNPSSHDIMLMNISDSIALELDVSESTQAFISLSQEALNQVSQ